MERSPNINLNSRLVTAAGLAGAVALPGVLTESNQAEARPIEYDANLPAPLVETMSLGPRPVIEGPHDSIVISKPLEMPGRTLVLPGITTGSTDKEPSVTHHEVTKQPASHKPKKPEKFWYGSTEQLQVVKQLGKTANARLAYKMAKEQPWFSGRQMACLDAVIFYESKFKEDAVNPSSGALGLGQALPGHKMRVAGANYRTSPTTQLKWMYDHYIEPRYGTPCNARAFQIQRGWY